MNITNNLSIEYISHKYLKLKFENKYISLLLILTEKNIMCFKPKYVYGTLSTDDISIGQQGVIDLVYIEISLRPNEVS